RVLLINRRPIVAPLQQFRPARQLQPALDLLRVRPVTPEATVHQQGPNLRFEELRSRRVSGGSGARRPSAQGSEQTSNGDDNATHEQARHSRKTCTPANYPTMIRKPARLVASRPPPIDEQSFALCLSNM